MSKRGKLYIIPDENQIIEEEFSRYVSKEHLEGLIEFSDKYKLGYDFQKDDYQTAPCALAAIGHLVVKTEEDSGLVVVYIPKVVTDRQNIWIHSHEPFFNQHNYVGAFVIQKENDPEDVKTEKGLDNIIRICDRRNLFYEKKEVDNNARKKI